MSKAYNFDWQIEVPTRLLKGDYFDRWDEENGSLEQNCLFRVDSYGFFIYWQSEGRDGQVIELSQVSDIRPGKGFFYFYSLKFLLFSSIFQLQLILKSVPILWLIHLFMAEAILMNEQLLFVVELILYKLVIRI
jgi:hypothetical protein